LTSHYLLSNNQGHGLIVMSIEIPERYK